MEKKVNEAEPLEIETKASDIYAFTSEFSVQHFWTLFAYSLIFSMLFMTLGVLFVYSFPWPNQEIEIYCSFWEKYYEILLLPLLAVQFFISLTRQSLALLDRKKMALADHFLSPSRYIRLIISLALFALKLPFIFFTHTFPGPWLPLLMLDRKCSIKQARSYTKELEYTNHQTLAHMLRTQFFSLVSICFFSGMISKGLFKIFPVEHSNALIYWVPTWLFFTTFLFARIILSQLLFYREIVPAYIPTKEK